MIDPFGDPAVVERYEDWYATPFGRVADDVELRILRALLAGVPAGARILEVACGTAWFGAALREDGHRVLGLDRSAPMLERARARVPVVRADAQRLPFGPRTFDAVVAVAVLDYAEDPTELLREALRVARDRVALLALASGSWLGLWRRLASRRRHPIFRAARFFTRSELRALVRAAGGRIELERAGLVLPPALAGRLPALEQRLSSGALPAAGVVGLQIAPA